MAVSPSDLLTPNGQIRPGLFPEYPGDQLADVLAAWIAQGTTAAAAVAAGVRDQAVAAYVYAAAFTAVHQRMTTAPASFTAADGQGGHAYSTEQLRQMEALALRWTDAFNGYLLAAQAPTAALPDPKPPAQVAVRFQY